MPDAVELRILHWNIHSWTDETGRSNLERVADLIAATTPDVVSLVEVNEPVAGPSPLHRLATDTAYHSVFTPAFEYGTDHPHGQFGNAILSRLPLLDVRHHHLVWPPRIYDRTEPSEPRSLVLGRVQAKVGPVWIGSTHLPATDRVARDDAAERALSVMTALSSPWLLVGDFNAEFSAWRDLHPTLCAYPQKRIPTYPAISPTQSIDYCVARAGQHIDVHAIDATGSDHLPILVQFRPQM
jgi:endonuclease/exonuclease/phosphatase family metal-dependent hydrolase